MLISPDVRLVQYFVSYHVWIVVDFVYHCLHEICLQIPDVKGPLARVFAVTDFVVVIVVPKGAPLPVALIGIFWLVAGYHKLGKAGPLRPLWAS